MLGMLVLVRELLRCSCSVDDVAVLVDSVDEIQATANAWQRGMKQNGMVIKTHRGKSEPMALSSNIEEYDVQWAKIGLIRLKITSIWGWTSMRRTCKKVK